MDLFILYLIGTLPGVAEVCGMAAPVGFFSYGLAWVFYTGTEEQSRIPKTILYSSIGCLVLAVLIPDRSTIMLMAAGKAVIEASQTDAAKLKALEGK